jgi:hypothetical protein
MNKFLFLFIASLMMVVATPPVSAQTKEKMTSVQKQTVSPATSATAREPSMTKKVEYQLPYPGILPDNPLYMLKAARDRIMDFLIVDPVRKAEFYILQADKRLGMTVQLLDKGNTTLAQTTLSKGETYMDKAVSTVVNHKVGGKEVPGYLVDRLTRSLAKHGEILSERLATSVDPVKGFLFGTLEQVKKLQMEADKLK